MTETKAVDTFAQRAANLAMQGAADILLKRGLRANDIDVAALCERLREEIRGGALNQALDEAHAAVDAGMTAVATATFAASMRLAGARAAARFLEEAA